MKTYEFVDHPVGCPSAAYRLYDFVDVTNQQNNTPWQQRALCDAMKLQIDIYHVNCKTLKPLWPGE